MYTSQIGQDKWVLETLKNKHSGYFIEMGAGDGVYVSNTYFMETQMGWTGLCVEPNPILFAKLQNNRHCTLANDLVYSSTGEEVKFQLDGELSGIVNKNMGGMMRKNISNITLRTLAIKDLLEKYQVPPVIDYFSLDVEGNEFEILNAFPFDRYKVRCFTIEHNEPHQGPEMRDKIRALLLSNGYQFVKGNDDIHGWKHGPIDDFYIYPPEPYIPKLL